MLGHVCTARHLSALDRDGLRGLTLRTAAVLGLRPPWPVCGDVVRLLALCQDEWGRRPGGRGDFRRARRAGGEAGREAPPPGLDPELAAFQLVRPFMLWPFLCRRAAGGAA